jgi:hypothetical protein
MAIPFSTKSVHRPVSKPSFCALSIRIDNTSTIVSKSRGESGSPCLSPWYVASCWGAAAWREGCFRRAAARLCRGREVNRGSRSCCCCYRLGRLRDRGSRWVGNAIPTWEDDTRRVGAIFFDLFLTHLTQYHTNLRGWGYKYIAASQPRIC